MEVVGLLIMWSVLLAALTAVVNVAVRLRDPRYNGRTYDPAQPAAPRRAGAMRVGLTGHVCPHCDAVTYGWSDRCGRCHLPTARPSLSGATVERIAGRSSVVPQLSDDAKARIKARVMGAK